MPGTVKVKDDSLKRKRTKSSEQSNKRTRAGSSDEDENPQTEILLLESEILESKKNYNNIATLLELARKTDDTDSALFAAVSLCRVFLRLLASGSLKRRGGQSVKDVVIVKWLRSRLSDYKQIIVATLADEESASTALTLAMRILKADGQAAGDKSESSFPNAFLKEIVEALVRKGSEDVRQEFCEKFMAGFADIRYYTFKASRDILSGESSTRGDEELFDSSFNLLASLEVPDSAEDLGDLYVESTKKSNPAMSLNQQKKQAQGAWLAVLNLEPNRQQRKKVLEIMTRSIVPWFPQPERLMDFLTDSYNSGGATSLLALSGVFYLITKRNLDYPSFYRKCYALLDSDFLHSKHRNKTIRLLDTFLNSTHLPAVMIASFIKRMATLCVNAPPAAIVVVIPWIYNLFKRHPLCTFMIHRVMRSPEEKARVESEGMDDPFIADEEDPIETRAIDSCLWEVVQLQSHFHPNVATIAKIISEQFTRPSYNLEDFLDHSYSSLLEAELSKQVKKPPVVEFMIPKRVFLPQDPSSGVDDNLLVKMWDFQ